MGGSKGAPSLHSSFLPAGCCKRRRETHSHKINFDWEVKLVLVSIWSSREANKGTLCRKGLWRGAKSCKTWVCTKNACASDPCYVVSVQENTCLWSLPAVSVLENVFLSSLLHSLFKLLEKWLYRIWGFVSFSSSQVAIVSLVVWIRSAYSGSPLPPQWQERISPSCPLELKGSHVMCFGQVMYFLCFFLFKKCWSIYNEISVQFMMSAPSWGQDYVRLSSLSLRGLGGARKPQPLLVLLLY